MIDAELLNSLCCPETFQELRIADASLVAALNDRIRAGTLRDRSGEFVKEPIESGLIRRDGQLLFPIRHGIPVMLMGEAVPLPPGAP